MPTQSMTKQEQTDRDLRILRHVGQYRLSLASVIARMHFAHNENACKQVINRFKRDQWLVSHRGIWPGPVVYYQLTPTGAAFAGVPKSWASTLNERSIRESLQVLWWCCMTAGARARIDSRQVTEMLGRRQPNAIHCVIRRSAGGGRLMRMYLPQPGTTVEEIIKHAIKLAAATARVPELVEHVRAGDYGIQVLVTSPNIQKILASRFKQAVASPTDGTWASDIVPFVGMTVAIEELPAKISQAKKENERRLHASRRQSEV